MGSILGVRKVAAVVLVLCLGSLMNFPVVFGSSIMWTESYGGSYIEIAHSVVETSDGGYAIA